MNATQLIEEIESLPVGDGDLAGQEYRLYPAQKDFIKGAFGEGVLVASWSVARGNGKSGVASAIGLNGLLPDYALHQLGHETILVASSFSQARIAFDSILRSIEMLELRDNYRILDQQNLASIQHKITRSRLRVIGSDSRRSHGLRPNLIIADEPAQWGPVGQSMHSSLITSLGKRTNSRAIFIGTRPADELHFFSKMLVAKDESRYCQIHCAPEDNGAITWEAVEAANPGMNFGLPHQDTVKRELRLAEKDTALMPAFRALRLNQGVSDIPQSFLLEPSSWRAIEYDILPARSGKLILGLDLGSGKAMSAAAAFWPDTGRLEVIAAFPSTPNLEDRAARDAVDAGFYREMLNAGDLFLIGSKIVPVPEFLERVLERFGRPYVTVLDSWRLNEVHDAAHGINIGTIKTRRMGWKDGAEDVRLFTRAVIDAKVSVRKSLLMRAAIAEARTVADPAGNEKLAKATQGGRRERARDDAVAAAILAVSEGVRMSAKPEPRGARMYVC